MKFRDVDMAFNAYRKPEELGQPIYMQEYLENPRRDIRAFVIEEEVVASIQRIAGASEWKTNVSQGGVAKSVELSEEVEELALKAIATLELIYAGVDILEAVQGLVLLEVNASRSWRGLQKATGVDVARQIVQSATRLLKC